MGFTSIYREGFETVLFLQALVLEAGTPVVLGGVALGLAATFLIGFLVFALQARLPHKKMLIVTGIMIGGVLLVMVGNTVHVLQVVGWMPIHPIRGAELALLGWPVVRRIPDLGRPRAAARRGYLRDRQLRAGRARSAPPGARRSLAASRDKAAECVKYIPNLT